MAEPAVGFDVKGEQTGSKDLNESELLVIKGWSSYRESQKTSDL